MSRPAPISVFLNRLKFTHPSNSGCFVGVNRNPLPQEENRFSMSDNGAEQNISIKRDIMTRGWRKLYNQELHGLLIHLQR